MSFTESLEQLVKEDRNGLLGKHSSWERVELKEVASVLNGFAFSSSYFTNDEGKPLLRIRDILRDDTETKYSGEFDPVYVVKAGDLLIGMDGDFNCALWRGPDALLNQRACKLTIQEAFYSKKLMAYALPGYLKAINDATSSITVKHLSSRTVEEIPLPLPPRPEQDRIVAEIEKQFTRLDDAVAALKRVQANLKRYRASVLKAACEGRLVPTEAELARKEGRDYEHASELLKRILAERRAKWEAVQFQKMIAAGKPPKDEDWKQNYQEPQRPNVSSLSDPPGGWGWATWEQLSPRVTVGHVGPMKHRYVESGRPFLRSQNVRANRFDADGLLFIPPAFHAELSKSRLRPGDLVVVRSGSVGTTCVIPEHLEEANCSDLVIIQKPLGVISEYGAFYMNSTAQRLISAGKVGVALVHFNTQSVAALPVPVPPIAEQKRIVEEVAKRLSTLDNLEQIVKARLLAASQLRQTILRSAFSGKLVPQDPNDEPASVLLDRIRAERARAQEQKQKTPKATNGASSVNGQRRKPGPPARAGVARDGVGRRVAKLAQGVSPGKG